nr:reverse transcriptase domain-containing protein [Tanacetum cinerariifolium]
MHMTLNTSKAACMENLSQYGSDVLTEVHTPDNTDNSTINQGMQVTMSPEQYSVVNHSKTKITGDSNIIPFLISVIEQLKTQVINCTKINMDDTSVNDTLTTELERYKKQVKVLKEGQNVKINGQDNFSKSHEQNAEIDHLKQTLSEQLREQESLIKTVIVLKNNFKKKESINIDREIALENKIKHIDQIVYKRGQSAQIVHMLTKPKFFFDHSTKQALGNGYHQKDKIQAKPDKTKQEIESVKKSKVNKSQPSQSQRRSRVQNFCQFHGLSGDDANKHLDKFLHVTQSIKVNGVTDDALRLYLFPHYLTHHATAWFDRLPRNSINTFEQMAKMFLGKYFPPSMVTKLRNEITNFRQRPDTFYNGLTLRHRDTVNAAAATVGQTQNVYAAGAYQGGNSYQPQGNRNLLSYRSDNYLGPPGFNQNQNNQNQNFQNQNKNQGNNHPQGTTKEETNSSKELAMVKPASSLSSTGLSSLGLPSSGSSSPDSSTASCDYH